VYDKAMIRQTGRIPIWQVPGAKREFKRTKGVEHHLKDFVSTIKENFPEYIYLSAIDIGGADGWISDFISFSSYTSLDITLCGCDVCADGAFLPFKDDSFDVGLCKQMLPHSPDPLGICFELARVSRIGVVIRQQFPTGDIYKFLSNIDSVEDILPAFKGWKKYKYNGQDFVGWKK
jgi:hypothetical protein